MVQSARSRPLIKVINRTRSIAVINRTRSIAVPLNPLRGLLVLFAVVKLADSTHNGSLYRGRTTAVATCHLQYLAERRLVQCNVRATARCCLLWKYYSKLSLKKKCRICTGLGYSTEHCTFLFKTRFFLSLPTIRAASQRKTTSTAG